MSIIVAAILTALLLFGIVKFIDYSGKQQEQRRDKLHREQVECIERTDDPAWCLEVIP